VIVADCGHLAVLAPGTYQKYKNSQNFIFLNKNKNDKTGGK
jgi:hypothetical protein